MENGGRNIPGRGYMRRGRKEEERRKKKEESIYSILGSMPRASELKPIATSSTYSHTQIHA